MTRGAAREAVPRTARFPAIPLLSIAAVFYNKRFAPHFTFLLPVVHFLPGRVDTTPPPDQEGSG